jgi:hypothetical protein
VLGESVRTIMARTRRMWRIAKSARRRSSRVQYALLIPKWLSKTEDFSRQRRLGKRL